MNLGEYFSFQSIFSAIIWLILLTLFTGLYYAKRPKDELRKEILPSFGIKIFSSLSFAMIYLVYYGGGDTVAYWEGAINLHNLLIHDFGGFFNELTSSPTSHPIYANFNGITGYPPGWIYRESESFFVSKLTVFLSMLTLKSYLASSLIVAYVLSMVTYHFYKSLQMIGLFKDNLLKYAILYAPTVLFWCSGISKDSFVFISMITVISFAIRLYYAKEKRSINYLMIFLGVLVIFQIRLYVLVAMAPAILMAYSALLSNKNRDSSFKKNSIRIGFFLICLAGLFIYYQALGGSVHIEKVLNEILVTQQDFANNQTYGDKKYDLGLSGYTIPDLIRSTPAALIAAFYRPFPWEALSPLLLLNGIENLILILFTLTFFRKNFRNKVSHIFNSEILIFALFFTLIMGFSIGFCSGLFGVLVRFKSLILPFLVLLLIAKEKVDTPDTTV